MRQLCTIMVASLAWAGPAFAQAGPNSQPQAGTIVPNGPTPAAAGEWKNPDLAPDAPAPVTPSAPVPLSPQGQRALETAPSGTVVQWKNPDDGATASIIPQPAFQTPVGQVCREFQQTVTIGGQKQQAYGTACRQPDGSWHLQPAPSQVASASPPPPPNVAYPPPQVVNAYPPAYFPPGYYYPRPYYSTVFIGGFVGGRHFEREHGRR